MGEKAKNTFEAKFYGKNDKSHWRGGDRGERRYVGNFKIRRNSFAACAVDGSVIDLAGVESLAATPSKEVLIAKMLGSMMAPLYSFARVLQAKIDKDTEAFNPAEAWSHAPRSVTNQKTKNKKERTILIGG